MDEPVVSISPLFESYNSSKVIGMLATINEPGTMVLVKKYKLDVLMHEAYNDVAD